MDVLIVKEKIFAGLELPIKRFIASDGEDVPVTVEYYPPKDYENLFVGFLKNNVRGDDHLNHLIQELDKGADRFAKKVMLAFYSPWSRNQLPIALKRIATHSEQYPFMSELLMNFYQQHVDSVDATDDFGETAFIKTLKADQRRKTPLLFLVNHGAKLHALSSSMQDALMIKNPEVYDKAENNSLIWFHSSLSPGFVKKRAIN